MRYGFLLLFFVLQANASIDKKHLLPEIDPKNEMLIPTAGEILQKDKDWENELKENLPNCFEVHNGIYLCGSETYE